MKILVVQIGKIGDMILTTPLFKALRQNIPAAHIHAMVSRRGAPVVKGNPHLTTITVYRKDPVHLFLLLAKMRSTRYDVLIDPKDHYSTESALIARMSRANVKIGFNRPGKNVFSRPLPAQEDNAALHAAARNLLPLKSMGISNSADMRPELFPDSFLQAEVGERYGLRGAQTILLNVSAGDTSRLWEEEKWTDVAQYCISKGFRVLLSFQPSDMKRARLFHSTSIRGMIALIPQVRLVITPDTSIVHIASAFNVPQVALFPPVEWNLNKFRPLSDSSIVLQPKEGEAIAAIPAENVIKAIQKILIPLP
jgi:ADP-heptose:LPS heptosyltransferase